MPQWQQWFRGFATKWFESIAESLSNVDDDSRAEFEQAFQDASFPTSEFAGFGEAWTDLSSPGSVMKRVSAVLDAVDAPSDYDFEYLRTWFSIVMEQTEQLPPDTKSELLSGCGEACASGVAPRFEEIWSQTGDLEEFAGVLNKELGEGNDLYRYVDENTLEVTYPKCFCPLVGFKLVETPTLCNCSNAWLKSNLQGALLRTAEVERLESVLSGGNACRFRVNLAD
ncbi:hypothetical protein EU546_02965 [Candidatus Thorarchaeota archaeon]|jgi:hypothetical protein|nr:MAG: hypothetical protein EU546_02965 [Candidatus Thorarchaeota archaeon]